MQKERKMKILYFTVIFLVIMGLSIFVQKKSAFLYKDTIVKITTVKEEGKYTQEVTGIIQNGEDKGKKVKIINNYGKNQAITSKLKKGEQFFAVNNGTWELKENKRDGYVFFLVGSFVLVLLLIGGKKGFYSLISLICNTGLLLIFLSVYRRLSQIPLLTVMMLFCVVATLISLLAIDGWRRTSFQKVLATVASVFAAFFLCLFVMNGFNDSGLRYEEMQFLTRPYRVVFLSSLLIGTLGAAMDTVVTVMVTLEELVAKNPKIENRQLIKSGRAVGKDVTGSMVNVLLFAYISGAMPMLLLYLANGWDYFSTMEMHLSLELLRALCGGFGIVLSIPFSLGIFILFRRVKK